MKRKINVHPLFLKRVREGGNLINMANAWTLGAKSMIGYNDKRARLI